MHKDNFKALKLREVDILINVAIQGTKTGLKKTEIMNCHLEPRIKNGLVTAFLYDYLKGFCDDSNYWFCFEGGKENKYLIYRHSENALVFKIRKTNPIDTLNIRNGLYNRSGSSKYYIEHNVNGYLNHPNNIALKNELKDYKNQQIFFFHLGWSLSQRDADIMQLVILHTIGDQKAGLDWYMHLVSANMIEDQINETANNDLVNINDNTVRQANIIKSKRLNDDQRKQSV